MSVAYLDSSAAAKLVVAERETEALKAALGEWSRWSSSALMRVELTRISRRAGSRYADAARVLLDDLFLFPIDDPVLDVAAELEPAPLRALDAIHVSTALSLGADLGVMITYDRRMLGAARGAGLPTLSPR